MFNQTQIFRPQLKWSTTRNVATFCEIFRHPVWDLYRQTYMAKQEFRESRESCERIGHRNSLLSRGPSFRCHEVAGEEKEPLWSTLSVTKSSVTTSVAGQRFTPLSGENYCLFNPFVLSLFHSSLVSLNLVFIAN